MEIRRYNDLPHEAAKVRIAVFVEEQGFVNEMDDIDHIATHFVMFDNEMPVATCRIFWDKDMKSYILGRLAVLKAYRGRRLGTELIKKAEESVLEKGYKRIALHSQCKAAEFYRKQGYEERGAVEIIEGCPHVWMYKEL